MNRRHTINSLSYVKWGDLEDKGGVFLGIMEDEGSSISDGKLSDKTTNEIVSGKSKVPTTKTKFSPNLDKTASMQLESLEIHVPLVFLTAYTSAEFQMQEGMFHLNFL